MGETVCLSLMTALSACNIVLLLFFLKSTLNQLCFSLLNLVLANNICDIMGLTD